MINNIIRSVKKDFDRAIFYWLVLMLSCMFVYLFFHLSVSEEVGVHFIYSDNSLPLNLLIFNVAICMIIILLANDFYTRQKARELGVMCVCGSTFIDLVVYLLMQTTFLLLTAVPVGVILGRLAMPLVNIAMSAASGYPVVIHPKPSAAYGTILIIGFEMVWITICNLSFCFRNTINSFLHGEDSFITPLKLGGKAKKVVNLLNYIFPIAYFACPILIYTSSAESDNMLIFGIIGTISLLFTIIKVISPYLKNNIVKNWGDDGEKMCFIAFFREDLKLIQIYLGLFIVTSIILSTTIGSVTDNSGYMTLCMISFVMLSPLMAMALMFRFSTEVVSRKRLFVMLDKLGFLKEQLDSIVKKEVFLLYLFITLSSLLYV
ncbi:MAG: hypothetical protein HUJ56_06385, partial [Erysipelotrichaceae bacterium]|nr:hypothetical protein [Erysipelotrichaceae bacterium]